MKTLTKVIVGIVAVVIVIGLVYVLFFGKAEAPLTPSDWAVYTESVSGISFRAPVNFIVVNNGKSVFTGADVFSLIIPTTTPFVNTHLLHEVRIDIDTPTTTCSFEQQGALTSSTQVKINGVVFTRSLTGDAGAGNIYQGIDYTTMRHNLCYRVALFTHSTNGEGFYTDNTAQIAQVDAQQAKDITALFKLFDQIAGTIKFTK